MIITLCGGGSTFTPGIVKSIALRADELEVDEIRLYDINEERQRKIGRHPLAAGTGEAAGSAVL